MNDTTSPEERDARRLEKIRQITEELEGAVTVVFVAVNGNKNYLALKGPTPLQVGLMEQTKAIILDPIVKAYNKQTAPQVIELSGSQAQELLGKMRPTG